MKTISICNNKGGVGKSTITLFLADFFSSQKTENRKLRILVIDLDSQGSSAISLLGLQRVAKIKSEKGCLSDVLIKINQGSKFSLSKYLHKREESQTTTQKITLGELHVMVQEQTRTLKLEDNCDQQQCLRLVKVFKKIIEEKFDLVFLDMPAKIEPARHKLALAGLRCSDHILIPTEPTRITLNAMTDTFNLIQYTRGIASKWDNLIEITGIVLNKTDRRTKQYRLHHEDLYDMAAKHQTVVFDNFLPTAPALSSASDDSISFSTLRERYSTYYDNVRAIAIELATKCGYGVKKIKTK